MQNIPVFLQGIQKQSYDPTAEVNKPFLQPSPTEQKIKQMATQNQPKPQERKTSFTPDEFVKSVDTFIANNPGITEDEALDFVENHYKEKGFTVEGMEFSAPVEPVESGNTTLMSRLQESGEKRLEQSQKIDASDRNGFRKLLDRTALKAGSFSDIIGAGIGEAFETSGQLLSAITPDSVEDAVKNRVIDEFNMVKDSLVGQTLATTGKGVAYTAKEVYDLLPEDVQQDVESLGTVGLGILDAVGVGYGAKALKNAPGTIKDTVGKKNFLTQGTRDAYIAKETEKINKFAGQLSQPGKKQLGDVGAMKKSLSAIDTDDIGTYEDLSNRFSDKISAIATKQDELLPNDKVYEISSLGTKSKGGTIEVNFIENALDDMEKLYEKVGEIDNLERVRELRAGNLSVKDINDIAREYNVNFGKKAFNKDGSAKFSDIGQAFENTRKGVKEQARGLLPDDTMKVLDSELSDLYTAKNLSDDMVAKVETLKNRLDERGFIANLSRTAGNIVDILTLGAPKELFSAMLLKGGMGKATLDSLTLQNRLSKNIKLIEKSLAKIEKAKDARVVSEILESLATQIGLTREQINTQAAKAKDYLGDLADSTADRIGARQKLVSGEGTGISGKIDAPKKYDRTFNIQDRNDLDYLKRILGEERLEDLKSGNKFYNTGRGTTYEEIVKGNIISKKPQSIQQELAGKIKDYKPKSKTFYHGTSIENSNNILKTGYKAGSELPSETFRGGGYGKMQSSISFAETPKEANIFASLTKNGKIIESKLKDNAKVVTIDGVDDAIDLEDYISYLKKNKIDAVYIGGGEKELVVINSKAVEPIKIYNQANK